MLFLLLVILCGCASTDRLVESDSFIAPPEPAAGGQEEEVLTEEIEGGRPEAIDIPVTANDTLGETRQPEEKVVSTGRPGETGTFYQRGYVVGPGDVLEITVWDEPDLSNTYKVLANGNVDFPLLEEIRVAGLTAAEIDEKLTALLERDYIREPKVTVVITEYHSQKVHVFGRVSNPGVYEICENPTLLKLLLEAGGPTEKAGDPVMILRFESLLNQMKYGGNEPADEGIETFSLSLGKLLLRGDLSQNKRLVDGDVVLVSDAETGSGFFINQRGYYLLGEIENPGFYPARENYTLLDLLLDSGRFTEYAAPNRTRILRGEEGDREVIIVKAQDLVRGDKSKDIKLEPGDIIVIPEGFF